MNQPIKCPHHPHYAGKRPPFSKKIGCTCEAVYQYAKFVRQLEADGRKAVQRAE